MKRVCDSVNMQPKKKQKIDFDDSFMGKGLSEFCSTLGNHTSSLGDGIGGKSFFKEDHIGIFENVEWQDASVRPDMPIRFNEFLALEDAYSMEVDSLEARCTIEVPKKIFNQVTLDPEKVQWSAIDVDDDSNVFKYPKDLNATVEGYYHAYKHEDGAAECKGPGGYTYNLKDMRQIQGDCERILKREELSPPSVEVKMDKITFPKYSFPIKEDKFGVPFDCISTEEIEGDKVRVVVDLPLITYFDDYGFELWNYEISEGNEDPLGLKADFETLLKQPIKEGAVMVPNFLQNDERFQLNTHINGLSVREPKLFHPGSKNQVLDILHPSLYCYHHGVSVVSDGGLETWEKAAVAQVKLKYNYGHNQAKNNKSNHAWIPSECDIGSDGEVIFSSPLVGVHPDDTVTKSLLENLLGKALPELSKVLHYVRNFNFMGDNWDYKAKPDKEYTDFKGTTLQVVPKIVDYILQPGESYEGVWHMEGMAHERIMATVIYVSSRDDNIKGGSLRFKRAFSHAEGQYFREGMDYAQGAGHKRPVADFFDEGLTPLGSLETPDNALLIFPNTHVHKLSKMTNSGKTVAKRRICVFFICDPDIKMLSTKHVPNQSADFARIQIDRQLKMWDLAVDEFDQSWNEIIQFAGLWSLEQAKKSQIDLMNERKYYKNTWNVREVGLCEH